MISITELRAGKIFKENGQPYLVLKYEHTKMGRGTANIKIKIKNLKTGAVTEKSFISGARVEEVSTSKQKLQFLYCTATSSAYQDQSNFYFMNQKTFEQVEIPASLLKEQKDFLKEEELVEVLFVEGEPVLVELAPKMKFKVKETGPGVKGDSATNIFKPAILENGLKIKIPLFVEAGEEIWVDTRSGEYVGRVK
jgi:elongation factor P